MLGPILNSCSRPAGIESNEKAVKIAANWLWRDSCHRRCSVYALRFRDHAPPPWCRDRARRRRLHRRVVVCAHAVERGPLRAHHRQSPMRRFASSPIVSCRRVARVEERSTARAQNSMRASNSPRSSPSSSRTHRRRRTEAPPRPRHRSPPSCRLARVDVCGKGRECMK